MPKLKPSPTDLWLLPLGGTGEIGMNLNLYGHDGRWLMVDCGITFEDRPGLNDITQSRIEMASIDAIAEHDMDIVAIVVTHAHEDHLGALPHLWEQLGCTIYATPFAAQVLRNKFLRSGCSAPIEVFEPGAMLSLAPFSIQSIPMTHSTPETQGLLIETPAARIFHTADWKFDDDPVVGPATCVDTLKHLSGVNAVVCDSTNALELKHAVSESAVREGLNAAIADCTGRVVVSCFASNIARLQTIGHIAADTGRHLGLLGFSMDNMSRCARAAGYLKTGFTPIDAKDLGYLPEEEVLAIATGSQGEPGAALHRLSTDSHPDLNLGAGDLVVLSAKTIPGNEVQVAAMIERLNALGVRVIQADTSNLALHASGHGGAPELEQLFQWTSPDAVVPVHGEPKHLAANAEIAKRVGVPHLLVGRNGDLFDLTRYSITSNAACTGRLALDEHGRPTNVSRLAD